MLGGMVCRVHGSATPQVKAAALRRLAQLISTPSRRAQRGSSRRADRGQTQAVGEWAKNRGKDTTDPVALMSDPQLEAEIQEHVQEINKELAHVEQINRIKNLPEV